LTNLAAERVRTFYNGIAEQWIKEGKGAIKWTRLSCRTFVANAVRLQLHALWGISGVRSSHHLGNFGGEELRSWQRAFESHRPRGLPASGIQQYREPRTRIAVERT
jgi:hypothetical protein